MSSISIIVGRFLLGLYFLLPGIMKFTETEDMLAYMQSHGIGFTLPLLWFAGATNILGGLLLMSGRFVKLTSLGFVLYILIVNVLMHDFWTMPEEAVPHEMQNFIKNLGIMAGLLVLAGHAAWRPIKLQGIWKSDAASV